MNVTGIRMFVRTRLAVGFFCNLNIWRSLIITGVSLLKIFKRSSDKNKIELYNLDFRKTLNANDDQSFRRLFWLLFDVFFCFSLAFISLNRITTNNISKHYKVIPLT